MSMGSEGVGRVMMYKFRMKVTNNLKQLPTQTPIPHQ